MGFASGWYDAFGTNGDRARGIQKMVVQVIFIVIVPFCYQGLLAITYIIHDPFGEDMLDFPMMAFAEYVKDTCAACDLAQQSCPAIAPTPAAKGRRRRRRVRRLRLRGSILPGRRASPRR